MIVIDAGLFAVICLGMLGLLFLAAGVGFILRGTAEQYPEIRDERAYLAALAKSVGPVHDERRIMRNGGEPRSSRRPVRRRVRLDR